MQPKRKLETPNPGEITSPSVFLARLTWIIFGPFALLITTMVIINYSRGWLTSVDAIFSLIVLLMLLGRWVEMRSGAALTATGEPATWRHVKRYTAVVAPLATAIWVVANLLGNHVFARG
ncbi:MAG: hypothetical protein KJ749_11520 [Planctomycetes bacterium]|nr:hypothetical protein [Planctomycetota bacterium]